MAATRKLKKPGIKAAKKTASKPTCSLCGKRIQVRPDGKIVDAYYFGKIPLYRKSELGKMQRSGVRKSKIGSIEVEVYKYDPKPYRQVEYWECLSCYQQEQSPLRSARVIR